MTAFLSYARADTKALSAITIRLDREHIAYWIDRRDIPGAVPWRDELVEAIRAASIVVVCESWAWHGSKECARELDQAKALHKKIVYVDVVDQPSNDAVNMIAAALHQLSETDRSHTELLLRTEAWRREGRPRSALAREPLLRTLSAVQNRRDVPEEALNFLACSLSTSTWRRRLRILGSAVLAVSLLAGIVADQVDRRGQEMLAESAGLFSDIAEAHYRLEADVFDGLRAAAANVRNGSTGAASIDVLVRALDASVPDFSAVLPGPVLVGLEAATPGDEFPIVRDQSGNQRNLDGSVRPSSGSSDAAEDGSLEWADVDSEGDYSARGDSRTGVIEILDARSSTLHRRLPAGGPVSSVAFAPDGRTIAAGAVDGIAVFDVTTGVRMAALRGTRAPATDLLWDADGRGIWGITGGNRVSHWPWHTGARLVDDEDEWFVALSPPSLDGDALAVTQDGDVVRVAPNSGRVEVVLRTGIQRVTSAAFDISHGTIIMATSDGLIGLRSLSGGATDVHAGCATTSVAVVPDSSAAFVACAFGPVKRIDFAHELVSAEVAVPFGGASTVAFGGASVIVGGMNGHIYRLDEASSSLEVISDDNVLSATRWRSVSITDDGRTVLVTGDGTGKIGHLFVGRREGDDWTWYTIDLPAGIAQQSRAAALSPDGAVAAVGMADGGIHLFTTQDGNPGPNRSEVNGAVTGLIFVGKDLVAATRTGVIDRVTGCGPCNSPDDLVTAADQRLWRAEEMGLLSGS